MPVDVMAQGAAVICAFADEIDALCMKKEGKLRITTLDIGGTAFPFPAVPVFILLYVNTYHLCHEIITHGCIPITIGGLSANYHSDAISPTFDEYVATICKLYPNFQNQGRRIVTGT